MRPRRAAIVTAGIAAGAVAGGMVGRTVLRARRHRADPEADEPLSALPPDDLGTVRSFDGTEIAVRAAGEPSKPMIVFVHGFSLDLTTWHYQWTELSARYRCILFDLRSHGRSGRAAEGDVSPSAFGNDLAAVLAAVAPRRRVLLVGHSLGSMAILALAESHPELYAGRIAGCVFVGSAASDLLRGAMGSVTALLRPGVTSIRRAARGVNRLGRSVLSGPTDVGRLFAGLTQFGPDAPRSVVTYVLWLAARAPSEIWRAGLAGLMEMDLRHAVAHVTVPSLVVVGEHDRVTPRSSAVALANALPHGRLEVLDRAGHFPMMEVHGEFNRLLDGFVREVRAKPANRKRRTA